jgi:hypothetical protein
VNENLCDTLRVLSFLGRENADALTSWHRPLPMRTRRSRLCARAGRSRPSPSFTASSARWRRRRASMSSRPPWSVAMRSPWYPCCLRCCHCRRTRTQARAGKPSPLCSWATRPSALRAIRRPLHSPHSPRVTAAACSTRSRMHRCRRCRAGPTLTRRLRAVRCSARTARAPPTGASATDAFTGKVSRASVRERRSARGKKRFSRGPGRRWRRARRSGAS